MVAAEDGAGGPGWWSGLAGEGKAIDLARHCIVGMDFIACAEGRTVPSSEEQAEALAAVLAPLGRPATIIGASYGGMVGLALGRGRPELVDRLVVISAAHAPHPASTAVRELQRRIVALGRDAGRGEAALGIARGLAMLTYRTAQEFADRFAGGIEGDDPLATSDPGAYLRARGEAYPAVMSPERFLSLSAAIDRHRIDPADVRVPTLVISPFAKKGYVDDAEADLCAPLRFIEDNWGLPYLTDRIERSHNFEHVFDFDRNPRTDARPTPAGRRRIQQAPIGSSPISATTPMSPASPPQPQSSA